MNTQCKECLTEHYIPKGDVCLGCLSKSGSLIKSPPEMFIPEKWVEESKEIDVNKLPF